MNLKKKDTPISPFAEVIATSTAEFTAQCLESPNLDFPVLPALGSWVKTIDELSGQAVYAIVCYAAAAPMDSIHRAQALGLSLQQLRLEQPQIFAMIKAEFRTAIMGFQGNGQTYQHLPPQPPQIHQAVYPCTSLELSPFAQNPLFLRTILHFGGGPVDAVIAATLRQMYQQQNYDQAWLIQAGRNLNTLLKEDYDRLRGILEQIHP
ncbi:hypothetical protein [Synechococcus sp. PCC 6312]|uniref:hypothetical protein n=1 Tax=Synechococcus sp. (strain ATCC 27167 / PCC 6312) TaxID=195253 RepID=UPI00029EE316|nr:hypothetical protein [Synechococcus sp. PCC 6312]AFY62209.1 hypothetical protein Syn6312_3162 [Synechococcus sp. PCC 6312]